MFILTTEADGALDKARKHKKRQLEDTLNLVIKKRRVSPSFKPYSVFYMISLSLRFKSRLYLMDNVLLTPITDCYSFRELSITSGLIRHYQT